MKSKLTITKLKRAAEEFCKSESMYKNKDLFGVTDGKAVGTYIEHKFQSYLEKHYIYSKGSSAKGIDLPDKHINTDIKVTSVKQP
ncbi:MAG: restriction endonuclease, partial [Bacteroidota bacterium]